MRAMSLVILVIVAIFVSGAAADGVEYKGMVCARSEGPLVAGSYSTYEVMYYPGLEGIDAGNKIKICQSCQSQPFEARVGGRPQIVDSNLPGYVSARRSDGGEVKVSLTIVNPPSPGKGMADPRMTFAAIEVSVQIIGKPLLYGEHVTVAFGSEKHGFPVQAFTYPQTQMIIWAFAEYGSKKAPVRAQDPAKLAVAADTAYRFLVNSFSQAVTGDEIAFDIVPIFKFPRKIQLSRLKTRDVPAVLDDINPGYIIHRRH